MATVKKSLAQIKEAEVQVDMEKIRATTEADIRRYMVEDGYDPDADMEFKPNLVAQARQALGMTQQQMADLTKIPIATLRNWEQNRTHPDATATAFFLLLKKIPKQAKEALSDKAA